MKTKQEGISLFVAMITSILILGLALVVMRSIEQSINQSVDVETSTQIRYATESGVEAGFFHRNARGPGVSFTTDQAVFHPTVLLTSNWTLGSRATTVKDILSENETISIPFQWDNVGSPDAVSSLTSIDLSVHDIAIDFYRHGLMPLSGGGEVTVQGVPTDFSFGQAVSPEDFVLLDWSVTRSGTNGVQTFFPTSTSGRPCEGETTNICRNEFVAGDVVFSTPVNSPDVLTNTPKKTIDSDTWGQIVPEIDSTECLTNSLDYTTVLGDRYPKLRCFVSEANAEYVLNIRPLLPFSYYDTNTSEFVQMSNDSVNGNAILYGVNVNGQSFPTGQHDLTSTITTGQFTYTSSYELSDNEALGAFDYVVVD